MKNLLILLTVFMATANLSAQSLKFSPYVGVDYGNKFGSSAKPFVGIDFSYELNMGLEFGFGSYLSQTLVAKSGEEIRPSYWTDSAKHVRETPVYLFLKYNYYMGNYAVSPYAKVGQLRTSIYNNYENTISENKDITRDDTIFYGNNFYVFGMQYAYKNYYLAVEYKVRMLEQEYLHAEYIFDSANNSYSGSIDYTNRTYKANSISFLIGYNFNTKNSAPRAAKQRGEEDNTNAALPASN
ncbi:MAG: porin family protein [Alphaproteobacteria bacterium]|nr:porin family protein [Alphaproteobacteria bacterium]